MVNELQPEWLAQVRDVLETLNQGVIISDECPRIGYANAVFLEMTGRTSEELVGQYVKNFFPPEDVPWLLNRIGLAHMHGHDRFEFYLPQIGGGRLPVIVSARQLEDPEGRNFTIVTFTDIVEQKNAESELRRTNLLLEERERAIDEDLLLAARVHSRPAGAVRRVHSRPAGVDVDKMPGGQRALVVQAFYQHQLRRVG